MSVALMRHLKSVAPAWLALQQVGHVPNCQVKKHVFHTSSNTTLISSLLSRPLSTRPVSTRSLQSLLSRPLQSLLSRSLQSRFSMSVSVRPLSSSASRSCQARTGRPESGESRPERLSMKALALAPKPALYIGSAGLLPFVAAPLLMAATQTYYPEAAYIHMAYGAAIVSFLGGARWGFAIPEGSPAQPDWMNLGNSVLPSLLAWGALLCRDNVMEGVMLVIMGLGLTLHYDLVLLPGYPGWLRAMRTLLTLVATFSLVATLALKELCPEKITELRP